MIRKRDKFWGCSEKRRWIWGDVGRKTVLEAASSHQKCMIADSGQPCM